MPEYSTINLHPSTHLISSLKTHTYDVICIGSGWAGRVTAARVVKAGLTAIIVENELVGGDCPFWACVPSKVLLRSGEALTAAKKVGGAREKLVGDTVDVQGVFKRRDEMTAGWDDGQILVPMVEKSGAHLVRGTGRLTGVKKVEVKAPDGQTVELEALHAVVLCTGSHPLMPDVPGLKETNPWGPREATSASKVPGHLVILGAGAVGCEMATAFSSFGSRVTMITNSDEILPKIDPEGGKLVRESLVARGVQFYLSTKAVRASRKAINSVEVELPNGEIISGTEILIATGRKANTAGIGLEMFGLPTDSSAIPVDESLCVDSVPNRWLYAAGDINGRSPLTHMCKYHSRIASQAIITAARGTHKSRRDWDEISATADHAAIPQVIFTDPVVASVGLTRTAAQLTGRSVREITAPVWTVGAMIHADGYRNGWAQWIVDGTSNKLLGATFVGEGVTDLLHASTVAIVGGMTLEQLAHAVPSFPALSEVYLNLLEAAGY
jgi:pyruvate/2-oxoglutarate dehydrogenase complex dihydrolipoamide dehydrogenase (E3) component